MSDYELNEKLYVGNSNIKLEDIVTTLAGMTNFYSFKKEYYGTAGTNLNANDFKESGIYVFDTNVTITNRPTKVANNIEFLVVLRAYYTNAIQIWANYNSALYFRVMGWNSWSSWKKITIS